MNFLIPIKINKNMSLLISQNGQKMQKIDKTDFALEKDIQKYIHENPEAIPVYEIDEDKKLLVVAREFRTESGPIDALAIDKDGDIYVVETKLFKNADKRNVVAQALDYGASLWRHSDFSEFQNRLDEEVRKKFSLGLEEKIKDFFKLEDEQVISIFETMRNNLHDGSIKFVILMDSIDDKLKNLIVYINQNSQFDIYAVQMEYYKFESYEIIIPKIFGVEVKKTVGNKSYSNTRTTWDEQSFIAQTKEKLKTDAEKIISIYGYLKDNSDSIKWGTGNANGSFSPIIDKLSKTISPFSIYSDGTILVKFEWLENHADKNIVENYYNIFVEELKIKTTIISTDKKFKISSEEFLMNFEGVKSAIQKTIKG